jgi:endoglycosylceramidase
MRSGSLIAAAAVIATVAALPSCSSSSSGPAQPADAAAPLVARACSIALPALPDTHLAADGTAFRDALGRVVYLHGVDAGGRSKFAPYVPFDFASTSFTAALASYMDRAASWGIDAMRVPFTWAAVEPTQGQDDASYLSEYDQILDAAWAHGIYTVVDFHQDVYAEAYCGDGFPAWTLTNPPAPHHDCPQWGQEYLNDPNVQAAFDRLWAAGSPAQAGMLAMWDRMIARHKDRAGVVGFEVINEPGWGTQQIASFESGTLTAFYSMVVPHMRAAAPKSLVFIDPTGFDGTGGGMVFLGKPTGDGIVFAPHYYPLTGSGHPDAVLGGLTAWANIGASWNVPTFVGEFGAKNGDPNGPAFMTAHFDALDQLGISGTQWEYSVSADSWNMETYGVVAADGTEYPVAQAIVRPFARAVAGSAVASAYDSTSKRYTLTYAPIAAGGVTEVSLPSRAYPNGYAVGLTGGCVDATSAPGRLLVQSDPGATMVSLTVASK